MAKTVTSLEGSGKVTRQARKSEKRLIPWTSGPTTRVQRIKRDLWG